MQTLAVRRDWTWVGRQEVPRGMIARQLYLRFAGNRSPRNSGYALEHSGSKQLVLLAD